MTAPPLPASPCLRVKLDYQANGGIDAGSRFFLSYAGTAPTGANCGTLATDIAGAWNTHMAPITQSDWGLTEVDVLDIATDSGASGNWTGAYGGSNGTGKIPNNCCANVQFNISRRYRGGKPKMFFPPPDPSNLNDDSHWSPSYKSNMDTAVAAFFAEVEGFSVGAVGVLAHVNLSYYKGFTNITNSSGRERAVPTYRASALLDTIQGYDTHTVVGSQRRRRTSTTY